MEQQVDSLDSDDLVAVLRGDDLSCAAFLRLLRHPADIVEAMRELEADEWPRVLRLLDGDETRAEVVSLLEDGETEELVEHLGTEDFGALLRQMDSDDAADFLAELGPEEQRAALFSLDADERKDVETLLRFPDDSAGGIMQVERAEVSDSATINQAIEMVRALVNDGIEIHRVYVSDQERRLIGSVDLVDLLLHHGDEPIAKYIEPLVARVTPLLDQEEVAALFRKYDLVTLPVVDDDGRMIGRIVHDDIVDVLHEEAEEDVLRLAGTDAEELLYRDRALPIAKVRLPWLAVNLLGSLLSAALLSLYEPVLEQVIIIAVFVPVITAMGGNVGTQSATILTRGFATGRLDLSDVPRLALKELRVGLIMGCLCGFAVGTIAAVFFDAGRGYLGVVVGLAMVSAMTAAAVVGALAPAALKRLDIDPAIASGPFVTTANDIVGIVIYMSTALLFLEQLKSVGVNS
ncbi:MAG: magnesium transporter [Myxococcota bacterium]